MCLPHEKLVGGRDEPGHDERDAAPGLSLSVLGAKRARVVLKRRMVLLS